MYDEDAYDVSRTGAGSRNQLKKLLTLYFDMEDWKFAFCLQYTIVHVLVRLESIVTAWYNSSPKFQQASNVINYLRVNFCSVWCAVLFFP